MHQKPSRVLIIVQNLSVPFDRRVWLESQSLVQAGHQVSVICPQGPGESSRETLDGVRIYRYRPPRPVRGLLGYAYEFVYCWLRTLWLTLRVLAGEGFDVLQACNPPDTYFLIAALLKPFGKKFVYDQHDLCPELYQARFGSARSPAALVLRTLESGTYRTADHVISTNDSYREIALTRGHLPPGHVTAVRNGPDLHRLYRVDPQAELKHGRRHLCCYLGVMGPQDGVDMVLRAADVLVHQMWREDCHFALLGFGDCFDELRAMAHDLALEDHVTFTGRADDATIRSYLSTADVGLDPDPISPFNQLSTMNKTMEYMAFGLPIISFDLKETRVSAGPSALYVEHEDPVDFAKAVCAVLDDPERRRTMGEVGQQRVRNSLAWPYQSRRYVEVFETL